ncbi:MAG: hypothetical protein PHC29_08525 [Candidatus Omnitrophica bacterium]|nr:hypothetical protein [Candidatus Omnitrophota bacterium]
MLCKNPKTIQYFIPYIGSLLSGGNTVKDKVPWLSYEAIDWLNGYLNKNMKIFEFGGGGSTLWFSQRVGEVIAVEHDLDWHKYISGLIGDNPFCKYLLKSPEEYCEVIDEYPDNYFDIVFIDGDQRKECVQHALLKIKPQGYLMIDDSKEPQFYEIKEKLKNWQTKVFFGPKRYKIGIYETTLWKK